MDNCNSIWLPSLVERLPLIKELEQKLNVPITIFHALDGKKYLEQFKDFKHILYNQEINAGMVGCVLSHLELLKSVKGEHILIFEDDCTFHGSLDKLNEFIKNAPPYDILCLGTSETVESHTTEYKNYIRIFRFWGAHALIIKKSAALKIVETFERYSKIRKFLPADWLYSYAIKNNNLIAYAPKNSIDFFDYKRGIFSAIANRVRY